MENLKEYIRHIMKRDNIPYSKARRIAIEEMHANKLPEGIEVKSKASVNGDSVSLDTDKMDDILALMESENEDEEDEGD